ncbi:DUF5677 domain-containing protein [Pseudomonas syringae]
MDEETIRASLDDRGFLSPALACVVAKYRRDYSQHFDEVERYSDIAQELVTAAGVKAGEPHMLASLVFLQRAVRNCQAAVILCERGLIVEAQTLTRTAAEVIFYAGALINDSSVFIRIAREGDIAERKQASAMIETCSALGLTEQNLLDLQPVIDRAEGDGPGFSAHDAARVAGLMPFYDTIYRGFSSSASHATFRSMDSSFVTREDGAFSLVSGPSTYHLEFTLGILKSCIAVAMQLLRDNFQFDG